MVEITPLGILHTEMPPISKQSLAQLLESLHRTLIECLVGRRQNFFESVVRILKCNKNWLLMYGEVCRDGYFRINFSLSEQLAKVFCWERHLSL